MAELKLPRLLGAAKEFNIGQDTLIDFLIGKGFPKDDLKPTSKLTEEMYRSLQLEFQSDKAAKMKSDQVDLPKGALAEAKKKNKEEEPEIVEEIISQGEESILPVAEEGLSPVIENIEIEKLTGPKIFGKIELPVDNDTRPKKDEKRKRKRIPIEKKEVKKEDLFKDRRPGGGGGNINRDDRRGRSGGSGASGGGGRRPVRREDKLIDEKEIQEKIRETQAK